MRNRIFKIVIMKAGSVTGSTQIRGNIFSFTGIRKFQFVIMIVLSAKGAVLHQKVLVVFPVEHRKS